VIVKDFVARLEKSLVMLNGRTRMDDSSMSRVFSIR